MAELRRRTTMEPDVAFAIGKGLGTHIFKGQVRLKPEEEHEALSLFMQGVRGFTSLNSDEKTAVEMAKKAAKLFSLGLRRGIPAEDLAAATHHCISLAAGRPAVENAWREVLATIQPTP
jgi:hypothetical protein